MAAVPSVAQWRAASLPNALTEAEIERFLGNFDRTTIEARRNYAMALCLVDLGLPAGEVARLQLEDLNWREGAVQLRHTKSKRVAVAGLRLASPTTRCIEALACGTGPADDDIAGQWRQRCDFTDHEQIDRGAEQAKPASDCQQHNERPAGDGQHDAGERGRDGICA
jgi:hypothetical protein